MKLTITHLCHIVTALILPFTAIAAPTRIQSPDGSVEMSVEINDSICYSVSKDGKLLIKRISIALSPEGAAVMGVKPSLKTIVR